MTDRQMTYDELAEALGRSPEAARQIVKRRRWRRTMGNDGRARITVPVDELDDDRATGGRPPVAPSQPEQPTNRTPPGRPGDDRPDVTAVLTGYINRLERDLEVLRKERDEEREGRQRLEAERDRAAEDQRDLAGQLEGLKAVLDAERRLVGIEHEHAEEMKSDRDHWRALASRPWWKRLAG